MYQSSEGIEAYVISILVSFGRNWILWAMNFMAPMYKSHSWMPEQASGSSPISALSSQILSLKRYMGSTLPSCSLEPGEPSSTGTSKILIFRLSTSSMKVRLRCGMAFTLKIARDSNRSWLIYSRKIITVVLTSWGINRCLWILISSNRNILIWEYQRCIRIKERSVWPLLRHIIVASIWDTTLLRLSITGRLIGCRDMPSSEDASVLSI